MLKLTISLAAAVLLGGCISVPKNHVAPKPYLAPPGDKAPAMLRSGFPTRMGRHDSMSLSVIDRASCESQPVFHISEYTRPAELDVKPVAMAVDQPILLKYNATLSAGRTCRIVAQAQFESGKHYTVHGGSEIHILSLKPDTCSFGIVDEETKTPLPLEKATFTCPR
ncbi:MAG TPA: hypothetical protein VGC21_19835 [Telluria sp.]|jgi:hypothetical protein